MSATLILNNVRLSYTKNLFEPTEKGKRTCNVICSDKTRFFRLVGGTPKKISREQLDDVLKEVLKEKFNGKVPAKFENWAVRSCADANNSSTGERYGGYEDDDAIYFAPSRFAKQGYPAFVRRNGQQISMVDEKGVEEATGLFYAGCYVCAKINIAAYETKEDGVTKRGVTSFLEGLQFYDKGETFGGGAADATGFVDLTEDDEDESSLADDFVA